MNTAIFFYNISITAAFVLNAALFYSLSALGNKRLYLWIGIMFSLFVLDNLLPYMYELLPGFADYYTQHHQAAAYIGNLLGLAITFAFRMILLAEGAKPVKRGEMAAWGIILVLYLGLTSLYPLAGAETGITFLRSLLPVGVVVLALLDRKHLRKQSIPASVPVFSIKFVAALLIIQVADGVERLAELSKLGEIIPGRFLSAELFGIVVSVAGIIYGWRKLQALHRQTVSETLTGKDQRNISLHLEKLGPDQGLTRREIEVVKLVTDGLSNSEIAERIYVSEGTVKTHIHNIYQKLGVSSRLQLINALLTHPKKST